MTRKNDWREQVPKEELAKCKQCGIKIWIYWYQKHNERNLKSGVEIMDLCAPCYFKK